MSTSSAKVESFEDFYSEVKEIEKRDSVLTPKQQIDRLLRPGSTYFNLNPFEVLQVDPDASLDEIKKKYRRLSILVHPDKNIDDSERAQQAFEIVNRSWKILENEDTRAKCLDVYQEAKERTEHMIEQKRKKQRKEGRMSEGIPEDDPEKYRHAIYVMTMKLFADMERKRQHLETRDMEERKRKREAEIEQEEQMSLEKEWAKNFEESRQNRVDSWKTFQSGDKEKKKKKKIMGFKPPKPKPESR
ncbi:dnaJ homolog subfamily C member 8 [Aricia agestis]|uniref:dnaJ homolog subfamily C member 8 n=1 Tax=Aricia agestis TaxID=91739 RepID=UPI001C209893|nr:dnaJ homolog subfamily C member 8 [Aricia agestis]XP_041971101.1 dnaJ homolog subfamily C member 8 [Aricia agestis]XP_041971102.1 dnaJ homolog subfamily C member 8 [Aricia agestis]XP_041971104.1 dnaJ homolog subfamily C member 8 [Aricia agestis]